MGFLMTKPKGHTDVLFVNFHLYNVKFQLLNYSRIHKASAFNEAITGDNLCFSLELFTNSPYLLDKLELSQEFFFLLSVTYENTIFLQEKWHK